MKALSDAYFALPLWQQGLVLLSIGLFFDVCEALITRPLINAFIARRNRQPNYRP